MKCKKCKHWRSPSDIEWDKYGGHCWNDYFKDANGNKTPENGLRYGGTDGYGNSFSTGPNFGCIHFEATP